jgi:hypothetical protein
MRKFPVVLPVFLAVVVTAAASFLIWNTFFHKPSEANLVPDGDLTVEDRSVDLGDSQDEKLPQTEGGGAVNISFSTEIQVSLADRMASLRYDNPSSSNQSMVVEVVVQDTVLVRSGYLDPGRGLESLPLEDGITLSQGDYNGSFLVFFYDQESRVQASPEVEIPVTVHVSV